MLFRRTGRICAPGSVCALALGEADALTLRLAELEALALALLDVDALADDEGDCDNDAELLALLMSSRTANVTIARSSLVPFVPPTARLPCPAALSQNTHAHCPPTSISGPVALFAPFVGGV